MTSRTSIDGRILLWCLAATLGAVTIAQLASYKAACSDACQQAQERLNAVAEQKFLGLDRFLADVEADAWLLSRSATVVQALGEPATRAARTVRSSPAAPAGLQGYLRAFAASRDYADILLISTNWDMALSAYARPELKLNLGVPALRTTPLARAAAAARQRGAVVFSEFRPHPPTGRASLFAVAPVLQGQRLLGLAAVEVRGQSVHRLLQDYSGLGQTGETFLTALEGGAVLLLSPLRRDKLEPFRHQVSFNPKAEDPSAQALQGHRGAGLRPALQGYRALAWWAPVPRMNAAFVAQIAAAEVAGGPSGLGWRLLFPAVLAGLLAVGAAWLASRSVSAPLRALQEGVRRVTAGDWSRRVALPSSDEAGEISRGFDQVLERLRSVSAARDEASRKLEEATRQLSELEVATRQRSSDLEARLAGLQHENLERLSAEARLQALLDCAPAAVLLADTRGAVAYANEEAAALLGYARQELAGRALDTLIPAATQEQYAQWLQAAPSAPTAPGPAPRHEARATRKDGSEIEIELSLAPVTLPEGLMVAAALHEVSDRKAMQRALARAERQNRRIPELEAELLAANEKAGVAADAHRQFLARMREELGAALCADAAVKDAAAPAEPDGRASEPGQGDAEELLAVMSRLLKRPLSPASAPDEPVQPPGQAASETAVLPAPAEVTPSPPPAPEDAGPAVTEPPAPEAALTATEAPAASALGSPPPEPGAHLTEAPAADVAPPPEPEVEPASPPAQELAPSSAPPEAEPAAPTEKEKPRRRAARRQSKPAWEQPDLLSMSSSSPTQSPASSAAPVAAISPEDWPDKLDGLDVGDGLRRVAGNRPLYQSLLLKFRDSQGRVADRIRHAMRSGEAELAQRLAHTVRGLAGSIGAAETAEAARNVDAAFRDKDEEAIEAALPALEAAMETVLNAIGQLSRPPAGGSPAAAAARASFDAEALKPRLIVLESLLRAESRDARGELESLMPLVQGTPVESLFNDLAERLTRHDLDGALGLVRRINAGLHA